MFDTFSSYTVSDPGKSILTLAGSGDVRSLKSSEQTDREDECLILLVVTQFPIRANLF